MGGSPVTQVRRRDAYSSVTVALRGEAEAERVDAFIWSLTFRLTWKFCRSDLIDKILRTFKVQARASVKHSEDAGQLAVGASRMQRCCEALVGVESRRRRPWRGDVVSDHRADAVGRQRAFDHEDQWERDEHHLGHLDTCSGEQLSEAPPM